MSWNYRVVKRELPCGITSYAIHEVYYHEDGSVRTMTVDSVMPYGESIEELGDDLRHMLSALDEAIVEYSEVD